MRKKNRQIFFGRLCIKPEFILVSILSPTFVPHLVTLAWKMSLGMLKETGSLNGPLCAYFIRQNIHNRTRPRSLGYEYPCHISKWSVKKDVRSLMVIFHVRSWKMRKKICQKYFWRLWKNPEFLLINMFRPTYMPNLVALAWKMSSGMSKEAG